MNNGSFFRLDLETSKVVDGITYYEYIDLPELEAEGDSLRYPIRLCITPERVSFFVHYISNKDSFLPHHTEEVILDLPYNSDNKEALSSIIKRIYNTVFPISDYLFDLLKRRYTTNIDKEDKDKYFYLKDSQINIDSYSSLCIWGLIAKLENGNVLYQLQDNKKEKFTGFLRKLLLDFMFDLMHSDVFESSKYYFQMRERLMMDFFFSSIIKKCEYYYYRRLIRNRYKGILVSEFESQNKYKKDAITRLERISLLCRFFRMHNYSGRRNKYKIWQIIKRYRLRLLYKEIHKVFNQSEEQCSLRNNLSILHAIKKLYAEKLDKAEEAWTNAIMSPIADKHFSFSPEWYEDQDSSKKNENTFSISDSWFVNPEEEMERVVFPLPEVDLNSKQYSQKGGFKFWRKDNNRIVHYLNSYELSTLIGTKDDSSLAERTTKISKWFYRRFDFKDTFRLHLFNGGHLLFFFILTIFSVGLIASNIVSSIGIFDSISKELWDSPKFFAFFPTLAAVAFMVSTIYFHIQFMRAKTAERIDDYFMKQRQRRELRMTALLFLFFSGVSAFLFYFDNYIFQLLIIIGFFIFFLCHSFTRRNRIINNIHLLLPRLVASITAGWILLVIGNDIFQEHLHWLVRPIIVIIVFTFILYENNKTLPNISTGTKICRAFQLILISYSISLIVGIFAMDVLGGNLTNCVCQGQQSPVAYLWHFLDDSKELTLNVFPEYIIQFSFLAMFNGVFIQMIFEEKSITEI